MRRWIWGFAGHIYHVAAHIIKTLTFSLPDIDECARQMDTCTSSQRCENTEGSFVCRRLTGCGTGYTLDEGTQSCIGKEHKPSGDGSRISRKGVHMYKRVGVHFADFISFFLNIPWKWNNLVSLRPNFFIFIGYFKNWGQAGGGGGVNEPPEPPLNHGLVFLQ